jgi:fatty acyl-CoA reductase
VFLTGATGFMGKVLMEKLLRSCPSLSCIFILVRPKKGKDPSARVQELLECRLFDSLRKNQPGFEKKVLPVVGDILEPALGISEEDLATLCDKVSVVFHSAATVKFDEELKLSVQMNVVGTKKMLELGKKMKKLDVFIHVSTAYCNCDREEITECVYPPPVHPNKILDACEWMSDNMINQLSPQMIVPRPNTYTYTKALAEYLILESSTDFPVAIVRPSIVGASWQEPFPGWVDNFNGPSGMLAAIGKGILRMMSGNFNGTADVIPVDIATNLMIASAWYTAVERPSALKIYNCTTGELNKLTWGQVERASYEYMMKNPLDDVVRLPNPRFTSNRFWRTVNMWMDHYFPAWLGDLYCRMMGKKATLVRIQQKLWKSVECLEYFTSHEWKFHCDNVITLNERLSQEDREKFNFDVKCIHWPTYLENYCFGVKRYALNEDLSNMPKARRQVERLQKRNKMVSLLLWAALIRFLARRVAIIGNVYYFVISMILRLLKSIPLPSAISW